MSLKAKAQKNEEDGKRTLVALMVDEMSTRAHVEYIQGKAHGYVDVGAGVPGDKVAKEAMVLMVVSVTESWKVPIAYFLVDGVSGKERANIIEECLRRLHDTGVTTLSLTCDGPPCNLTMLRELGANLNIEDMDSSFPNPADPSQEVHAFLDVCHMVKLIRNAFGTGLIFKTANGDTIRWQYLHNLVELQAWFNFYNF